VDGFAAAVDRLGLVLPSPLVRLDSPGLDRRQVRLFLKRDDLIHPDIPGNKWRKLKYNLAAAYAEGASTLLTFGGAYSNHLRAVAAAAAHCGFGSIGVVRGEPHEPLNEVLSFARDRGMRLTYLDRAGYRRKTSPELLSVLRQRFGDFFLIPEGGTNAWAIPGCAELVGEIDIAFDVICCPCGTGGTLAGITTALAPGQRALGFAALKGADFLVDEVRRLQSDAPSGEWSIEQEFHFGGFAKRTAVLDEFIADFRREHDIELEWVYVAKMMYGLLALIEAGRFAPGTTIVAVVTG
jgi:1-aminocyclopropane-1-carboxylate deaminase